jgi:hypothetical protein
MSRRIEALDETAAEVSPRSSQPSQKKRTVKLASNLFLNLPEGLSELSLSRIGKMRMIACFIIDGSDRYTGMTINAINSFLKSTPEMHAGVLVPPSWGVSIFATRIVPHLIAPERVIFKHWSQHFAFWNPTQYKLDIIQFADDYDVILWLDSDTIVYDDLRPLLFAFYKSPAKYMFVRDHVCFSPEFLKNWAFKDSQGSAFVPQACFMGFKAEYMKLLFTVWEETWRQWIEPEPFKNFADPLPSFPGSAFCIEQYALGHALVKAKIGEEDILEIARSQVVLNTRNLTTGSGSGPNLGQTSGQGARGSGGVPLPAEEGQNHQGVVPGTLAATSTGGLPSSQFLATSAFLAFQASSYPSSYLASYPSSYLTSYLTSYSSYGLFGTVTYFDATNSSIDDIGSAQTRAGFGHNAQTGTNVATGPNQQPVLPELISMDNLGGCVVHFYNTLYDVAHNWWLSNESTITKTLKQ